MCTLFSLLSFPLSSLSHRQRCRYWQWALKIYLLAKFSDQVFSREEEPSPDHDLREHIPSKLALFATLQKHLGVVFATRVQEKFQEDPTLFEQKAPFVSSDISISVRVHSLPYYQSELQAMMSELETEEKMKWDQRMHEKQQRRLAALPSPRDAPEPTTPTNSGGIATALSDTVITSTTFTAPTISTPTASRIITIGRKSNISEEARKQERRNAKFLVRLQRERLKLLSAVFGENSLEAAVGLFKLAEAESRVENNTLALELVGKGCDILMGTKECAAEVIVGYYYLRGTIYERMNQFFNAFRAYRVSLDVLETVYGNVFLSFNTWI